MYTWEIEQLLTLKEYLLSVEEYLKILDTSPQIRQVSYNSFTDEFYIETDERFKATFKVKKKESSSK